MVMWCRSPVPRKSHLSWEAGFVLAIFSANVVMTFATATADTVYDVMIEVLLMCSKQFFPFLSR